MSVEWREHGFVVSAQDWPLVRVAYPGEFTVEGYRALFDHYAELAARGARIGWLIDMLQFRALAVTASDRRVAADIFEAHRAALMACTVGEARVVDGAIARCVVTAFDWLTPRKWPCTNVTTEAEARAWLAARMGQDRGRTR